MGAALGMFICRGGCHVAKPPLTLWKLKVIGFGSESVRIMEKTAIIYKLLFAPTTGKVKSKADFTEKK